MNILIVDDDEPIRSFMEAVLSLFGRCSLAQNGLEAVRLFEQAHAENRPFDIIFLDIVMPKMDGQEALSRIRKLEEKLNVVPDKMAVIIMATALMGMDDRSDAFAKGGCSDYLLKPISEDTLIDKLGEYFHLESDLGDGIKRRKYQKIIFQSKAQLSLSKGTKIQGMTSDVTFNSILFIPNDRISIEPGTIALVRISLNDASEVEELSALFSCWVVRSDENGIVLKIATLPKKVAMQHDEKQPTVMIKRSDGNVEAGWEIFQQYEQFPPDVAKKIKKNIMAKSGEGPVVVCFRKSLDGSSSYKILTLKSLKDIQQSVGSDVTWIPSGYKG